MIPKKEFYFVRHGQTDYNKMDPKIDHADVSLNQLGVQQAKGIEPIIAKLPVKTICFSPLIRAKETKEIIAANLSADHVEVPDLGECSAQVWLEMNRLGYKAHLNSEDPVYSFMQRVLRGLNHALSHPGPVLIVAHGGVHWAMCCFMDGEHEWLIDNCTPVHFSFGESGKWKGNKLLTPGNLII